MGLFAQETDMPDIYNNWEESFGDTKEEITAFFKSAGEDVRVCVIRKDGVVATQLCLLPVTVGGTDAWYLYAVATNPAYREKGLCTQLLKEVAQWLKKQETSGILVPADNNLQAFYKQRGFNEYYPAQKVLLRGVGEACIKIEECTVEHYIALRKQAFLGKDSVEVSEKMLRYALEGYLLTGYRLASFYVLQKEYGVLYLETEELFLQEITAFDKEEAKMAGEAFLCGIGKEKAWLQRSYLTMGVGLPEGIKEEGYFNLVLD